jgi:hypothetical protein
MSVMAHVRPGKAGWLKATLQFIANKGEVGNFSKVTGAIGATMRLLGLGGTAVAVLDDAFTLVPGVDVITIADNVMWLYGAYAFYRIYRIRREANRSRALRYQ